MFFVIPFVLTYYTQASKPIVLGTIQSQTGAAKLFLSASGYFGDDRSLVFRLPTGKEIILAEECGICEKGSIFARKNDFVVAAIPSRVPQLYVVTMSGVKQQLQTNFGHEDGFWVTRDRRIVFEQLNYSSGDDFLKVKQYQVFSLSTGQFKVFSVTDAKRQKLLRRE